MKRIVLGGVLGGIAMFLWEGLAHEVLPLGQAGVKGLNNEPAVLAALKAVKEPGFYLFPWPEESPGMTSAQKQQAMQKAMEKARLGPAGLLVVHPEGTDYAMGKLLGVQCALDVGTMLLAAFLVAWSAPLKGYGSRATFVTALGLLPTLTVHLPLWNWYRFPGAYTMAQFFVHLAGFLIGGLIVAATVRPARYI
jgi:hypothetical protein